MRHKLTTLLFFLFLLLLFSGQTSSVLADEQCSDDITYCDSNSNKSIRKHGGYFDEELGVCQYAFDELDDCSQELCPIDVTYCADNRLIHKHSGVYKDGQCFYREDNTGDCSKGLPQIPSPKTPVVLPDPGEKPSSASAPKPPQNLIASCQQNKLQFNWSAVRGADHYRIRIDDLSNLWGAYFNPQQGDILDDDVKSTNYSEDGVAGRSYDWWVHSVDNKGNFSGAVHGFSVTCSIKEPADQIPQQLSCNDDFYYCDPNTQTKYRKYKGSWTGSECSYEYQPSGKCETAASPPASVPVSKEEVIAQYSVCGDFIKDKDFPKEHSIFVTEVKTKDGDIRKEYADLGDKGLCGTRPPQGAVAPPPSTQ